jgi:hypothetical protein
MKLKHITLAIGAVALAAAVAVALLAIRGGLRAYALNKVLRLPQAQARLAVKPTRRTLTNSTPVRLINMGYASFDVGSTNHFFVESVASGASVSLTNRDVSMVFLPPFAPCGSSNLASSGMSARANPNTLARLKEWKNDQMAAEIAWEETQPMPPSRILLMNNDDFRLYSLKVAFKAGNRFGSKGVEFFQSPFTKGIVRFGETTNDNRFVAVHFRSLDDTKSIGLLLRVPDASSSNLSDYLDPILRSFRFTAEAVDDREMVKDLIRDAGIPQRKATPADE